jgi:class 3 adenylate cyclase
MAESRVNRKLAAILSADVVGYSKLMADDEAATVDTLKQYRAAIGHVIERHEGHIVNAPGDNILAEFASAVEAVQGAVEIQRSIEGRNVEITDDRRMHFRVGVNLGNVIEEDDGTSYGEGVNIAARMEALAEEGGICISSTIYDAVEGKLDFGFDFIGEQHVKNIAKPVRVYRVRGEAAIDNLPITGTVRLNTLLVVATFVIGLVVDRYGGLAGQLALSVWSWSLMFRLIATSPSQWRVPFYCCLIWATAGEIFLSVVWGLYTYRLGNIPFFVPPGHVMLFWFGLVYAPRLSRLIVAAVPVAAVGYAVYAFGARFDTVSIPLVGLFLLCWLQPGGRRLYSLMLVISLMAELYGTWVGNWVWHADVPYFRLSSNNPPIASGSFYCILVVLIGLSVRSLMSQGADSPRNTSAI